MRRILVVTSGRADASPLTPVVTALRQYPGIEVFLSPDYSYCDLVILLGDRHETLQAALDATVARKPIAHIHGGEITYGSFDNRLRYAITELSHIHFTATVSAARRLLKRKLDDVYLVGAPGLDNLVPYLETPRNPQKTFIVTYHPATLDPDDSVLPLIDALREFPEYRVFWTGTNTDPGSDYIRETFQELAGYSEETWDLPDYLAAMRQAALVIGNSSSGIIEAPFMGVPSLDVGRRQEGREGGWSVYRAKNNAGEIIQGIEAALRHTGGFSSPYLGPGASRKIAETLAELDWKNLIYQ